MNVYKFLLSQVEKLQLYLRRKAENAPKEPEAIQIIIPREEFLEAIAVDQALKQKAKNEQQS